MTSCAVLHKLGQDWRGKLYRRESDNSKEFCMNLVFVLDAHKQPLAPYSPRRAKLLLRNSKAAIFRRIPFTIILKRAVENPVLPDHRVKIDQTARLPGSLFCKQIA